MGLLAGLCQRTCRRLICRPHLEQAGFSRAGRDAVLFGFDIFVLVIVVLAIALLFADGEDRAAGLQLDRRAFRPIHRHAAPRPQSHHAGYRPHRSQDQHDGAGDRHSAAGRHHQGQRDRHGRRARLLPGDRRRQGELRDRQSGSGDRQADHDQYPFGDGLDGPRPDALASRRDQRAAAARGRCGGRAVGREGQPHRDQGHRAARKPGAVDGPADAGGA